MSENRPFSERVARRIPGRKRHARHAPEQEFEEAFALLPQAQVGDKEAQEQIITLLLRPMKAFANHIDISFKNANFHYELDEMTIFATCMEKLLDIITRPNLKLSSAGDFQSYTYGTWTNLCRNMSNRAKRREHLSTEHLRRKDPAFPIGMNIRNSPDRASIAVEPHYMWTGKPPKSFRITEHTGAEFARGLQHRTQEVLDLLRPCLRGNRYAVFAAYLRHPEASQAELADEVGITPNAYKVALFRARKAIEKAGLMPQIEALFGPDEMIGINPPKDGYYI